MRRIVWLTAIAVVFLLAAGYVWLFDPVSREGYDCGTVASPDAEMGDFSVCEAALEDRRSVALLIAGTGAIMGAGAVAFAVDRVRKAEKPPTAA